MLTTEKNLTGRNYTKRFIVYSYALFWAMILMLGAVFMLSGQNPNVMKWLSPICSWAPTISLLLLFKKLFPDTTVKEFYKKAFSQRISVPLMLVTAAVYILLINLVVLAMSIRNNAPFTSFWNISLSTFFPGLFLTVISGPMGEESGWRGFLLPVMWKKAGVIKGALLLSLIWAPWHAPLWYLLTGFTGIKLLVYILIFILGNMCLSVIISICYNYNRNLFVPIWIHFIANVIELPFRGDGFEGRLWMALFYPIVVLGFILWHKRRTSKESA